MNVIEKFGGATRFNLTAMILFLCLFVTIAIVYAYRTGDLELMKIVFPPFIVVLTGVVTYFYGKSKDDGKPPEVVEKPELLG